MQPFADLTAAVWRRFPETPPYAGAYDTVVPHLTVGASTDRPALDRAAAAVATQLPVRTAVDAVTLIAGTPDRAPWQRVAAFPLGG